MNRWQKRVIGSLVGLLLVGSLVCVVRKPLGHLLLSLEYSQAGYYVIHEGQLHLYFSHDLPKQLVITGDARKEEWTSPPSHIQMDALRYGVYRIAFDVEEQKRVTVDLHHYNHWHLEEVFVEYITANKTLTIVQKANKTQIEASVDIDLSQPVEPIYHLSRI
jgi:hypothetical protein